MIEEVILKGKRYVTHALLWCGEINDEISVVEYANVRHVKKTFDHCVIPSGFILSPGLFSNEIEKHIPDHCDVLVVSDGGTAEGVYFFDGNPFLEDVMESIRERGSIDDDSVCEVEAEWEDAAWRRFKLEDIHGAFDGSPDEGLYELMMAYDKESLRQIVMEMMHDIMNDCNLRAEIYGNEALLPIKDIADHLPGLFSERCMLSVVDHDMGELFLAWVDHVGGSGVGRMLLSGLENNKVDIIERAIEHGALSVVDRDDLLGAIDSLRDAKTRALIERHLINLRAQKVNYSHEPDGMGL